MRNASPRVPAAVHAYLFAKADQQGRVTGLLQSDIADAIGVTQGPVSLAVINLEADNLLRIEFDRQRRTTFFLATPVAPRSQQSGK